MSSASFLRSSKYHDFVFSSVISVAVIVALSFSFFNRILLKGFHPRLAIATLLVSTLPKLKFQEQLISNIVSVGVNFAFNDIDDLSATKSAFAFINSALKCLFYSALSRTCHRDAPFGKPTHTAHLWSSSSTCSKNSCCVLLTCPSSSMNSTLPSVLGKHLFQQNHSAFQSASAMSHHPFYSTAQNKK